MAVWSYPSPLVHGTYLRRRKRFFADVRLDDGTEVVAHCANTGAMTGLDVPGVPCRISPSDNPARSLAWSLEQLFVDGHWVMAHTARPNAVVEAALRADRIPALGGYDTILRERPYGDRHRIDLLLLAGGPTRETAHRVCYVEVKNVTLLRQGLAAFPDAVSARGERHLRALAEMVNQGHRAVLVPFVARADARAFVPADDVDPAWASAYRDARAVGVEVVPLVCGMDAVGLDVIGTVPAP